MPRIVFRGKTYYSVYEMPPNVRRAYEKEQKKVGTNVNKEKNQPEVQQTSSPLESEAGTGIGMRGLIWGILAALIVSGIAFLLSCLIQ